MRGKLIVIDGPDCSGKDSVLEFFESDKDLVISREPGGTPIGESVRSIVLSNKMDDLTKFLLFSAARRQHVVEVINKQLDAGNNVLLNRYYYSSIIYQGDMSYDGIGLPESTVVDTIKSSIQVGRRMVIPDISIILYSEGFKILKDRIISKQDKDVIEENDIEYFERVNKTYKYIDDHPVTLSIEDMFTPKYIKVNIDKFNDNPIGLLAHITSKINAIMSGDI